MSNGRVVMITGGGGGIGGAMAREFVRAGDRVALCDVELGRAEAEAAGLPRGAAKTYRLDVASETSVDATFDAIVADLGGVDVLCNNAGVGCWSSLEQTAVSDWDRTMAINVRGMFLCARRAAPVMRTKGSGCIVNTASVHSFLSWPECSVYAASKGAVLAFTRSIALELLPHGIRVNAIAPGTTDTDMFRLDDHGEPLPADELEQEARAIPIGRVAKPEEIARVARFLASEEASFMVGACVAVDGGATVRL